jgi:toxin YhaV
LRLAQINGWTILGDPHFVSALNELLTQIEKSRSKNPNPQSHSFAEKKLAAIKKLIESEIARDPKDPKFLLGHTLGPEYAVWRRAKFLQQYRLFFRFDSKSKVIVLSWFTDETTRRAFESKRDAYLVFLKMLERGKPPTSWRNLLDSIDL